jgi:hypothetical protein
MAEKKKARGIKLAAASLAMVVVGSGAALAATDPGTNAGEVLRGTDRADTIHGYGGADLIYGYGGGDTCGEATSQALATRPWAAPDPTGW